MNAVVLFLIVLATCVSNLAARKGKVLKPEFQGPLYNKTLETGMSLRLICRAVGEKPITFKWYNQDGDEITEGHRKPVYVRHRITLSMLLIGTLGKEHEGSYTCTASNAHGQASREFFVGVFESSGKKPEFDSPRRTVSLESGLEDSLSCRARGEKPITYKWYNKDGDEIARSSRNGEEAIYVIDRTFRSDLFFNPLYREHEGSYTCTASNAIGETSEEVFLRVDRPSEYDDTDSDNESPEE